MHTRETWCNHGGSTRLYAAGIFMCDPCTVITCSSTTQCSNSAPREPRSECFSKSEREPSVKGIAAISQAPAMMSLYKHH